MIDKISEKFGNLKLVSFMNKIRRTLSVPPKSLARYRDILHEDGLIDLGDSDLRTLVAKKAFDSSIKEAVYFLRSEKKKYSKKEVLRAMDVLISNSLKQNGESLDLVLRVNRQINPNFVFERTESIKNVLEFLLNNKKIANSALIFAQNYNWEGSLSEEDLEKFHSILEDVAATWFQDRFHIVFKIPSI